MKVFEVIVIGASLGGLNALQLLFAGIAEDFQLPIVVVLHRHKDSDSFLLALLQNSCVLPVHEAQDKCPIEAANIYLAPADYHLIIENGHFALSTAAAVSMARPSIDVLFESCADAYEAGAIAVILTGNGHDGAQGVAKIEEYGGRVIVEEPSTAEAASMPEAAIVATATAEVFPLAEMSAVLTRLDANNQRG